MFLCVIGSTRWLTGDAMFPSLQLHLATAHFKLQLDWRSLGKGP